MSFLPTLFESSQIKNQNEYYNTLLKPTMRAVLQKYIKIADMENLQTIKVVLKVTLYLDPSFTL